MANAESLFTAMDPFPRLDAGTQKLALQGKMKPSSQLAHPNETRVALLKCLAHYHDQRNISKVMTNPLGAAMHLAILRSDVLHPEQVPADINGDDIRALARLGHAHLSGDSQSASTPSVMNEKEIEFARKTREYFIPNYLHASG